MPFVKAALERQAKTLPAEYYTSPEIFARENERVFGREWLCAGRAEQIQHPGDYFLTQAAGESLIVVRDRAGAARAFFNVCRHRGTRICERDSGHFSGSIQCPYHAWTYGLDGALLAARTMDDVPEFDKSEYGLHEAGCAEFEGFVFVNVSPGTRPFEQAFAPLQGRFAQWGIERLRSARSISYDLACNWKLVFLNYSECYHCPVLHPQLDKLSPSDSGRNDLAQGPFLGGYSELRAGVHALTASGTSSRAPLAGLSAENHDRVYYYTIFPSMLLSLHPDYVMVHYVQPVAPAQTRVVCEWLFDPDAMAMTAFDPKDAVEFWDLTNRQDWHVNELTQLGVQSRAYTPGPYAHAEALLAAFDRYYLEIMER
ncbi:MAG TPA: aromatic ring-hydroxylating dioxygenase subunit alpha [Candidatus Baltobacteraceae bacterium]|nr:aromatic ring-hydroxylating dioxygenase subunit alpha [Candidatus Baltobacteraceae bacterium]